MLEAAVMLEAAEMLEAAVMGGPPQRLLQEPATGGWS